MAGPKVALLLWMLCPVMYALILHAIRWHCVLRPWPENVNPLPLIRKWHLRPLARLEYLDFQIHSPCHYWYFLSLPCLPLPSSTSSRRLVQPYLFASCFGPIAIINSARACRPYSSDLPSSIGRTLLCQARPAPSWCIWWYFLFLEWWHVRWRLLHHR